MNSLKLFFLIVLLASVTHMVNVSSQEKSDLSYSGVLNERVARIYNLHNQEKNNFLSNEYGVIYLKFNDKIITNWAEFENLNYNSFVMTSNIKQFTFDPQKMSTLYAIDLNNNLIKTLDRGKNWLNIKNNIPKNIQLISVKLSSLNPDRIYIETAEGMYFSENGGFSYQKINFPGQINDIILDTKTDGGIFIRSNNIVYYTSDNGKKWDNFYEISIPSKIYKTIEQIHLVNDSLPFFLMRAFDELYRYDFHQKTIINVSPFDDKGNKLRISSLYVEDSIIMLGTLGGFFYSNDRGFSWNFKKINYNIGQYWITGIGRKPNQGFFVLDDQNNLFNLSS